MESTVTNFTWFSPQEFNLYGSFTTYLSSDQTLGNLVNLSNLGVILFVGLQRHFLHLSAARITTETVWSDDGSPPRAKRHSRGRWRDLGMYLAGWGARIWGDVPGSLKPTSLQWPVNLSPCKVPP